MIFGIKKFSKSRQKGNLGEDVACLFLMKQGFKIVDRNYLVPWGEIDIVAEKRGILHFVEVKSVSCEIIQKDVSRETVIHETIRPEENMTESKIKRLERAIKSFFLDKRLSRETMFQLDLLTIRLDSCSKTALVEKFDNVRI